MTQEEEKLLLKDLCARIPCGVKMNHVCEMGINPETLIGVAKDMITLQSSAGYSTDDVENYRPYLFPLSSMTESQCYELSYIKSSFQDCWKYIKTPIPLSICNFEQMDFFYRNHFDIIGLIDKGLAIDATNLGIYELRRTNKTSSK